MTRDPLASLRPRRIEDIADPLGQARANLEMYVLAIQSLARSVRGAALMLAAMPTMSTREERLRLEYVAHLHAMAKLADTFEVPAIQEMTP